MRTAGYASFRSRLQKAAEQDRIPARVMFELTYDCNFRCQHCYVPQAYRRGYRRKELTTSQVFAALRRLKEAGCFYLGMTGGEPFLRKDIFRILDHARRLGFELIINTNGSLLDKSSVERLARLRLNKVDITLPAWDAAVFDKITGVPGSRARVFRNIAWLHGRGVRLGFKTCLLKGHEQGISKIQAFCRSLKARHRLTTALYPRLDGARAPCGQGAEPRSSRRARRGRIFSCGAGSTQAALTPAGELKFCLMIDRPRYKLLSGPPGSAWLKLSSRAAGIETRKDPRFLAGARGSCPADAWLRRKART